jgi:hypothetical protein
MPEMRPSAGGRALLVDPADRIGSAARADRQAAGPVQAIPASSAADR